MKAFQGCLAFSAIDELDISFNVINGAAAKRLANELPSSGLHSLILSDNMIDNNGAKAIGQALYGIMSLQRLELGRNRIGNRGVASIAMGVEHSLLRILDLTGKLKRLVGLLSMRGNNLHEVCRQ